MENTIIHNILLYLVVFLSEINLKNAQFFNPTFGQNVDPGTAYYTTYMLCTQTPVEYRTSSCRRNSDCPVPNLTQCMSTICCAKDQISLQALSVYKLMAKETSGSTARRGQWQSTNNNQRRNEGNQNRENQNQGNQNRVKHNQENQAQGRSSIIQSQSNSQTSPRQQQQEQQGKVPRIPLIQFKQDQQIKQTPDQNQGSFQQRFTKGMETGTVIKPLQRIPNQNLIQDKQPRIVIQDTVGMSNSLSGTLSNAKEAVVGKSMLSSPAGSSSNIPSSVGNSVSHSQISRPVQGNFVTELTAEEAAKRRAHMQNANHPQQRVSQTAPSNTSPSTFNNVNNAGQNPLPQGPKTDTVRPIENTRTSVGNLISQSQISRPVQGNFVTELTAEEAAKRRAHMQNANRPKQQVSNTAPSNPSPSTFSNVNNAGQNSLSQAPKTNNVHPIENVRTPVGNSISHSQISRPVQGNFVTELTAEEAAKRRAHMQNANRPQQQVSQTAPRNPSASTFENVNNAREIPMSQAPKIEAINPNAKVTSASSSVPMECDDIAIIGAGISGTYTAWRLKHSKLKVSVYEATDRIGGRILTYRFREAPDINVELGAMTFLPDRHKRVSKAAYELKLPVINFAKSWNDEDSTLYYLREVHMRYNDLGDMNTPYNLREHELKTPDMLRRYLSKTYTNFSGNMDAIEDEMFNTITSDGIPLYHQSYSEAFAKMGSGEASTYLRDQSGFHCTGGATSAALGIPVGDATLNITSRPRIQTVAGGMDMIPKSFMKAFFSADSRNKYHQNSKLVRIRRENGNKYHLHFSKTETINGKTKVVENSAMTKCAKSVILTLSRNQLDNIDWKTFKEGDINSAINSVIDCPVCKLYFVYDYPWWRTALKNYNQTKTDLPVRRTFDYGVSRSTGKAVLLVSYSDGSDVQYWRQLQSHGRKIGWRYDVNAVTEHVVNHAHIHLSYVYNISMNDIPAPRDGSMMIWDDGWSTWKPGVVWPEIRGKLIRPSPHENIFIVPSYYKNYNHQMWSLEGAFESADRVLNHYGLPPYA